MRPRPQRRPSATAAVDDFIALVGAVDGILQAQASADVALLPGVAEGPLHRGRR